MSFLLPLAGGLLIGLAAAGLLLLNGRVAGISGIFAGLIEPRPGDKGWRALFIGGLVAGAAAVALARPGTFQFDLVRPPFLMVAAGLLVGSGTRLANGCTSGHGICGVSRFSPRSLIATATFTAAGALTVFVTRHLLGAP
ncbi:MAG TPA: YeeE/YedE thiosulfate transporter family protein [Myxococcales bacterium]|nr:YeeE/YedE thiosulfate transporter family protein [Myxococcales bacterium]